MAEQTKNAEAKKDKRDLTKGPVRAHLLRLSGPMVIGIVSVIIFNLVDTWYVSQLGADALTAISFTFPVVSFVASFSIGLGIALASMVSRALGSGAREAAVRQTTHGLIFALAFVAVLSAVGILTIDPLFRALGATADDLVLIHEYMRVWYFGAVFIVVPMVGNSAIRATGDTRSPALIMLFAAITNAIIDPLLIFGLGPFPELGMKGAALSTVISRALTFVFSIWILSQREHLISAAVLRKLENVGRDAKELLILGIPAAATQTIGPITIGLVTRLLADFGDVSVAAFGAGGRVEMVLLILPYSLAAGMAPFVGQNFGAGRLDRLADAMRTSLFTGAMLGVGAWVIIVPASYVVAPLFSDVPDIQQQLRWFLWIVPASHFAHNVFFLINSCFNAVGEAWKATVLAGLRTFVFVLLFCWLFSRWFGVIGVFFGVFAANVATAILSLLISRPLWNPQSTNVES